jgi:hypothetical protein
MKLPAASQLSTEDMLEEMLAAMPEAEGVRDVFGALCCSSAGRQLNERQVTLLISAAVSSLATCGSSSTIGVLVYAYGMNALCSDVVAGWLHSAVQCRSSPAVKQLLCLQAAKQLSIVQAVDLLAAAIQLPDPEVAAALATMQQASAIAPGAMLELLQIAVQVDSPASAELLCSMAAAAARLDAAAVARLFKHAVGLQQCATAAELLVWIDKRLQGQQQLWQEEQLQQLCAALRLTRHQQSKQQQEGAGGRPSQQIMQQQQYQQQLRKLRISADVLKLLRLSVQQCCSSALRLACRTAVVQQVVEEVPVAAALLQLAIEQGGNHLEASELQLFEALCLLLAARQLDVQQVANMLLHALQLDNTAAVEVISGMLPAARCLAGAGDAVQQLQQLAAAKGLMEATGRAYKWFAGTAVQLRRLPAASGVHTSV